MFSRGKFPSDTLNLNNHPTNFCSGFKHIYKSLLLFPLRYVWGLCPLPLNTDLLSHSLIIKKMQQKWCCVISKFKSCGLCLFLLGYWFWRKGPPRKKSNYSETAMPGVHGGCCAWQRIPSQQPAFLANSQHQLTALWVDLSFFILRKISPELASATKPPLFAEEDWPWANICAHLPLLYMWDTCLPQHGLPSGAMSAPGIWTSEPRPLKQNLWT